MSTTTNQPVAAGDGTQQEENRRRRRKVAAILAGGLVLGVGATYTLASWNDSEFGSGTFTGGKFNLEGSTDGTTFADHATAPGAALSFSTPFNNLAPGNVVYAPFSVRLAANTTSPATVKVASIATTDDAKGNATKISWAIYKLAAGTPTCDAAGVTAAGTALATGTDLSTNASVTSTGVALGIGSPTTNAGAAVPLCVVATAGAIAQGGVTTSTWQFAATSN